MKTKLQSSSTRITWEEKRKKRIQEAMDWSSGTKTSPRKHLVATLSSGAEVYFLKPGKEVFNEKRPNPYDMLPVVGSPDTRPAFEDIWSYLSKISVVNFEAFKAVLTLIYRSAYLIDHIEQKAGIIRYQPSDGIIETIDNVNRGFRLFPGRSLSSCKYYAKSKTQTFAVQWRSFTT